MRRGILSSLPDDDYLSIGLLRLAFNLYATICRATDRQGILSLFMKLFNHWRDVAFDKALTRCRPFLAILFAVHSMCPFR
jgi:hypothetical protein